MFQIRRKKKAAHEIFPDEIFLDSHNLPEFDTNQFEGRIERSISKTTLFFLGCCFACVALIFLWKLSDLQVRRSEFYKERAENNRLEHHLLFTERGVIFDRNLKELAWNEPPVVSSPVPSEGDGSEPPDARREDSQMPKPAPSSFVRRNYIQTSGFAHLLGYVRYPKKDDSGYYYEEEIRGAEGVEHFYDELLKGENGLKLFEHDASGVVQSENTLRPALNGEDLVLTIDSRVQEELFRLIESVARDHGFSGGAGVLMDVHSGEILALTSFPEYDSSVLTEGSDTEAISSFRNNQGKPFLNRVVSGLYAPGSIVKPMIGIAALEEKIIKPDDKILSTGSISIQNPYFEDQKTVFNDWKAHGWVDMRDALAFSSNVYFFEVGGGYEKQEGLGIERIKRYLDLFGLGKKTGIDLFGEEDGLIPTPEWKETIFGDEWRIGDTYNTSIGQYGFQITPLQALRAQAAIANNGTLLVPKILHGVKKSQIASNADVSQIEIVVGDGEGTKKIAISPEHFKVVQEGLRQAVLKGTASGLNIPQVSIAAKTGTAEVGITKKKVNSWTIGFFPYDKPRYAFAVVMEQGPRANLVGALFVVRGLVEWMAVYTPEYLKN